MQSTLRGKGLSLKSVTLTAKDKICLSPGSACTGSECLFAKGYYNRIGDAVREALEHDTFTRDAIEALALSHSICAFELSLDLSLFSDVIICDYNYVFDPRVSLKRYFIAPDTGFTLLIDEAHNLVDRSREMFSAEIRKQPFLDVRRSLKDHLPDIYKTMGKVNSWMVKARKRCEKSENFISEEKQPEGLYPLLKKFRKETEQWLIKNIKTSFRQDLLDLYFTAIGIKRVSEQYDCSYTTCLEKIGRDLRIKLFCIDPSEHIKKTLSKCIASVFFSATLTPAEYFKNIFGCNEAAITMQIPSPFPDTNLCVLITDRISTLYKQRERTAPEVAQLISTLTKHKSGNYLFFFPSYEYMLMVHSIFKDRCPDTETIIQSRGMTEQDRDLFLENFTIENPDTIAGFAVMGGIFGEGIDLVGERLSGAVIIGVGLPWITHEREIIRKYFQEKNGSGFQFAYLYPGINRVLQAAGRVIRSEEDKGLIVLVDNRFSTARYRSLLPPKWKLNIIRNKNQLEKTLDEFWD